MPSCPSNTALFQVASRRAVIQNDQAVQLAEGDIAFADGAGPRRMFLRMGARNGWLSICRARCWFLILDSSHRVFCSGAAERVPRVYSLNLFKIPRMGTHQRPP